MLKFVEFPDLATKKEFIKNSLESQPLEGVSWVVSDLKSKLFLQNCLIEKQGYALDSQVLRISELWKRVTKENESFHAVQWISREGAQLLVDQHIKKNYPELKSQSSKVFNFIQNWISILMQPEGSSILLEWAEANQKSSSRWLHLFKISNEVFTWMKEQNLVCESWRPEKILSQVEEDSLQLNSSLKSLIVDVGVELKQTEAELFNHLSQYIQITLLIPEIKIWKEKSPFLFKSFELFYQKNLSQVMPTLEGPHPLVCKLHEFQNPLNEFQWLSQKILELNQKGVSFEDICIVSPQADLFKNSLYEILQNENIPCGFSKKYNLFHFPQVQTWLSRLRVHLKDASSSLEFADVTAFLFGQKSEDFQTKKYSDIYHLLYNLLEPSDLEKHLKIPHLQDSKKSLSRVEFMIWALKNLDHFEALPLENLIKEIFAKAPAHLNLEPNDWLGFLEKLLATLEISVSDHPSESGVSLVGLMSAEAERCSHRFFIHCSQEAIEASTRSLLQASEVDQIARDLGFYLPHPESHLAEFELQWLMTDSFSQSQFSFSQVSLKAETQTKARALHSFELISPKVKNTHLIKSPWSFVRPALQSQDFTGLKFKHYSAHSITDYLKCPFITLAKKGWALEDPTALDLKPDPMKSGILTHSLFELILQKGMNSSADVKVLESWIEEVFQAQKPVLYDKFSERNLKNKLLKNGMSFWNHELEIRKNFPFLSTWGTEISFEVELSPGVLFKGVIDRIDTDHLGNIVVYDYKNKTKDFPGPKGLINSPDLQIWIYVWLIEKKKALPNLPGSVVAAFYYNTQTMEREKGFRLKDADQHLYELKDRRHDKMTFEERDSYLGLVEKKVLDAISGIQSQEFNPKPADEKDCSFCSWKFLCHAPHLLTAEPTYEF